MFHYLDVSSFKMPFDILIGKDFLKNLRYSDILKIQRNITGHIYI